jgi:hypothetical protein
MTTPIAIGVLVTTLAVGLAGVSHWRARRREGRAAERLRKLGSTAPALIIIDIGNEIEGVEFDWSLN